MLGKNENSLYSSSQDGTFFFWSISNAGSVNLISKSTIDSSDHITDIIFSPDGNTIDVEIDGQPYQVRYDGIDSPSIFEDCGVQAQNRNRALAEDKTVMLILDMTDNDGEDEDYKDKYGRLIRYVIVDDHFVNYELLELGYAKVSIEYPAQ